MQLCDVMMRVGTGMLCLFSIAPRAGAECSVGDAAKGAVPVLIAKDAEVYDKKSNLTWQRCSIGQRWEASSVVMAALYADPTFPVSRQRDLCLILPLFAMMRARRR